MIKIFKIFEFVLLFIVLNRLLHIILPGKKRKTFFHSSSETKRFDGTGKDISDADYEEVH
jgi:hypothetical protein